MKLGLRIKIVVLGTGEQRMRCGYCGLELKNLAGLSIHIAKMHPDRWASDAKQIEAEHEMIVEKHNRWKQARGDDKK